MTQQKNSLQQIIAKKVCEKFEDAIVKKIDRDNYLDIHIPSINEKKGTHLGVNTAKDVIRMVFYCRDVDFIQNALSGSNEIEEYSHGIRPAGNPLYTNIDEAVQAIYDFIHEIQKANSSEVKVFEHLNKSEKNLEDQDWISADNLPEPELSKNLIAYTFLFDNYLGYANEYGISELQQLIKKFLFSSDWEKMKSHWEGGGLIYQELINGITTYEEGFERVRNSLQNIRGFSENHINQFLELCLVMYKSTSKELPFNGDEITQKFEFNTSSKNYNRLKFFEFLEFGTNKNRVASYLLSKIQEILKQEEISSQVESDSLSIMKNHKESEYDITQMSPEEMIDILNSSSDINFISTFLDDILELQNDDIRGILKSHYSSRVDQYEELDGILGYIYCRLLNEELIDKSVTIKIDDVEVPLISKGILKIPSKGDIEGYFLGHWNEIVKLKYLITNENLSIFFDDLSKLVTIGTTLIPNADDIDYDFQTYEVEAKPFFNYDDKIVDTSSIIGNMWDSWEEESMEHVEDKLTILSEPRISFDFFKKINIMNSNQIPENITPLHAMNFLYLTFAHSTDDDLSQEEFNTIVTQLKKWDSKNPELIDSVVKETMNWYKSYDDWDNTLQDCVECINILSEFPDNMRKLILEDLIEVAKADGEIKEEEIKFFNNVANRWKIEINLK